MPAATKTHQVRGLWFLTLFAAEEIPATIVTFVALLMFLQQGASAALATLCASLLFLPWVLKSFLRAWVRRAGHFRWMLLFVELLLSGALLLVAFSFTKSTLTLFGSLLLVSLLCAWHELAARMYYERMLRPHYQRLMTTPKIVASQVSVILTYGALIFLVSILQVYFRQIGYAWSLGCYVAAGVFMLFGFYHMLTLRDPMVGDAGHLQSVGSSVKAELHVIERIRRQPHWWQPVLMLFLLLLPQSLMFHARVLYLYYPHTMAGLGCTMQEIGFAQGTIGVIAFSVGIAFGRRLIFRHQWHDVFWPMAVSLSLSPLVYLVMTIYPPAQLWMLCCCTFLAQLFFGFGLGICRLPVKAISGARYRNTINLLQIPLVSMVMLPAAALSGWLVESVGFRMFFLLDALSAPICLLLVFLIRHFACKNDIYMQQSIEYATK